MSPRRSLLVAVLALALFLSFAPSVRSAPADIPLLVADKTALETLVPDAVIETLPGGYVTVVPEPFTDPTPVTEPRYQWTFPRRLAVYVPTTDGRLFCKVTIHYQPTDRETARKIARLVARLLRLHQEHFGRMASFPRMTDTARVFLAPESPAGAVHGLLGGETRDADVYLFATGLARTPLEWVRTVAHEWGHLTLVAARGYSDPESDAAGFLGERLHFKWLREDARRAKAPLPDDGTTTADLDLYYKRQIAPLMDRFQKGGPTSKELERTDARGMDYYIGATLALDATFGSRLVGQAIFSITDITPQEFFLAFERQVQEEPTVTVRLPAWIPLTRAKYEVLPGKTTLTVRRSGWQYREAQGSPTTVTLRRIPVQQQAEENR